MTTGKTTEENGVTRREALASIGGVAAGAALASGGVMSSAMAAEEGSRAVKKEVDGKMTSTISLDWKEVYYTNCPLISASNVDQELGWVNEEYLKEFVDSHMISYPIMNTEPVPVTELGPVLGLPTSYIISPDGERVARQEGPVTREAIEKYIARKQRVDASMEPVTQAPGDSGQ